jgi:Ca-activated chloride channel homolog
MKTKLAVVVLGGFACAVLLVAQSLVNQNRDPAAAETDQTIVVDVTRVNVLFTVTDKKGRFVTDLVREDFTVAENKKQQNIQEFNAESDLPLRIGVLIDTSNSIRDRFRFEQEAAIEFISSVIRPAQDKAMLVSFDTAAELVVDLTEDPEVLAKGVRSLRAGGGTALYDAIFFACRDRLQRDQPRHKFRRAIVIVSDGDDNQSRVSRDQALEMAQKADVVLYAISTNITRAENDGDKVLKYLTAETGGQVFFPFKVEDLQQSFENIANELRHQYNIFYRPEPLVTDGRFRNIDIKVRNRRDLVVRARKGYYAPLM